MARRNDGILDLLALLPWWVSVLTAGVVYVALAHVAPAITTTNPLLQGLLNAAPGLAPLFGIVLLIPAPISAFNAWRKRRLLDEQEDIASIRSLSWKQFEELVAEAYRRQEFRVVENTAGGADGGVDIRLVKNGETHLVQCKQWRSNKVGVNIVREMFGVMTAQKAASVIIVTSGHFTREAQDFAAGKPIQLVDGPQLADLIGLVREAPPAPVEIPRKADLARHCPRCGSDLVLRTAKKGPNAGSQFWGCSTFPKCRHTEPAGD